MRKLIGTIAIIAFVYVGFFGCSKYNMKPFIIEWFNTDGQKDAVNGDKTTFDTASKICDVAAKQVERDSLAIEKKTTP